jgi:hypothetical protein
VILRHIFFVGEGGGGLSDFGFKVSKLAFLKVNKILFFQEFDMGII